MDRPVAYRTSAIPVAGAGCWIAKKGPLRFAFGDIPLFTVWFSLLIQELHFTKLLDVPDSTKISMEQLPPTIDGFLIRSQPAQHILPRLSLMHHAIRYIPSQYERFYVELQNSFAEYLSKFSSKSRNTLHRKIRKFSEFSGGQVDWRIYRSVKDLEEYYPLAREVSSATYQERLLKVGLPDREEFRNYMLDLARQDRARGYLLFHHRKPIAYLFCAVEGSDILRYSYLGYKPEFSAWSPGTVLQYFVFENLFAERQFRIFDFTEGAGEQKRFLSTGSIRCADIFYFRRRGKILIVLALHATLHVLSKVALEVLDRLGVKERVKRFLRSVAVT